MWDRKGGLHSSTVNRLVHKTARSTVREKQLEWGSQTPSFVMKHTAAGARAASVTDYREMPQATALIVGYVRRRRRGWGGRRGREEWGCESLLIETLATVAGWMLLWEL